LESFFFEELTSFGVLFIFSCFLAPVVAASPDLEKQGFLP
jgi:hypothetical protein